MIFGSIARVVISQDTLVGIQECEWFHENGWDTLAVGWFTITFGKRFDELTEKDKKKLKTLEYS